METKIRTALISVFDKTGIVEFAHALTQWDVTIISTGGTARLLRDNGIAAKDVSDITGFPEMLDGRVKTLHPRIHGGILAIRHNQTHQQEVNKHQLTLIDMVVVNLYPFQQTAIKPAVTPEEIIENIDIGGPTMIRAAAKNFRDVAVVVDPTDYEMLIKQMQSMRGGLSLETRFMLARKAFAHTASYDAAIADFFENRFSTDDQQLHIASEPIMPRRCTVTLRKRQDLRYGENPHQQAALYEFAGDAPGVAQAEQLQGKELSFNNLLDLDAAWNLVSEFDEPACVIIKHTNPCGAATAHSLLQAYQQANATDPVSAFGGILAFNRTVDGETARELSKVFVEAVIAPDFDEAARQLLAAKKNVRIMRMHNHAARAGYDCKKITGGLLLQSRDADPLRQEDWKVATKRQPTHEELSALQFAWKVCKHVKSNAIVFARPGQLVGVGAGQMSRIDSVKIAAMKARLPLAGTVVASDAFFPFRDGVDEIAQHGATAVIQPGGSVRDQEVIAAADEHGLAMVLTGMRHFRH
ncbi:MAG: bifunctional phosphoribosylaminoimidazolecarboxamide formyltransferase/IMP cyclohydrolase [Acidobacteriota bacterium]|nr:bifunctional phosphoribosylaminoimidazolecarboxamide formyltransferase/IMP cyclohydrolase [Blastocatellia bacterium]MDW8238122.1 bifunctional phosphoribosylaminoimidazolecarboxamide formyltransferase/IMP cyclohydrolase [Acidobacteriota bacterium]